MSLPQPEFIELRQAVGCSLELVPDRFSTRWDLRTADHYLCASIERGNVLSVACAHGRWRLARRARFGWSMTLEGEPDGAYLGRYAPRLIRPGGAIILADSSQTLLQKRIGRARWFLTFGGHTFATLAPQRNVTRVVLTEIPVELPSVHHAVFTACGIVLLVTETILATVSSGVNLLPEGI
jgi:hypothetical protein